MPSATASDLRLRRGLGRLLRWTWRQLRLLVDVRANPATFVYLFTLIVTSVVVSAAGPNLSQHLLQTQSTNLANLRHHPIHVLFTSAFWLDDGIGLVLIAEFALILAPAERWLGTARTVLVFALGHVGATAITAIFIAIEAQHGLAPRSLAHTIDVGASYGLVAVGTAYTHRISPPRRRIVVVVLFVILLASVADSATFTDFGHVFAALIGLACWRIHPVNTAPVTASAG